MRQPLSWFAPAKINLYLHVIGRRPDGYHLLDSLVVFAETGDRLSVTASDELSLTVAGPFAGALASEGDNLVLRAARALAERCGVTAAGHIRLEKNLPVASGVGGGSSDAAAALRLMMAHWQVKPSPEAVTAVALRLGADVPACLVGRALRMSGIGETLTPSPPVPDIGLVLVNPGIALPTAAVFRARSGPFSAAAALPAQGWPTPRALVDSLEMTRNDLEAPARTLVPAIGNALEAIRALPGCLVARMSGSGATCFGIFASPEAAANAAPALARPGWWIWGGGVTGHI